MTSQSKDCTLIVRCPNSARNKAVPSYLHTSKVRSNNVNYGVFSVRPINIIIVTRILSLYLVLTAKR